MHGETFVHIQNAAVVIVVFVVIVVISMMKRKVFIPIDALY